MIQRPRVAPSSSEALHEHDVLSTSYMNAFLTTFIQDSFDFEEYDIENHQKYLQLAAILQEWNSPIAPTIERVHELIAFIHAKTNVDTVYRDFEICSRELSVGVTSQAGCETAFEVASRVEDPSLLSRIFRDWEAILLDVFFLNTQDTIESRFYAKHANLRDGQRFASLYHINQLYEYAKIVISHLDKYVMIGGQPSTLFDHAGRLSPWFDISRISDTGLQTLVRLCAILYVRAVHLLVKNRDGMAQLTAKSKTMIDVFANAAGAIELELVFNDELMGLTLDSAIRFNLMNFMTYKVSLIRNDWHETRVRRAEYFMNSDRLSTTISPETEVKVNRLAASVNLRPERPWLVLPFYTALIVCPAMSVNLMQQWFDLNSFFRACTRLRWISSNYRIDTHFSIALPVDSDLITFVPKRTADSDDESLMSVDI